MVKRTILLAVIGALAAGLTLLPATSEAQVAKILRLQGRLLSQAGTPIPDGDYGVTLRFYKKQTDAKADALLVYIDAGVKVANGLFAISIGETTKLDVAGFISGDAAWLGLQVGSDDEMPRIALHYVAYALRADLAADLACSGCVSAEELDPKVLEPYAKTESLHKVATSGKYEDVEGTPDLTPYAKSDDLHKVAKTGKYDALEGLPPLADLKVCAPGELLQGYKPDGVAVCVKDADTQYTGKDFALSNLKCGAGEVVQGIGIDGKPLCVKDANDKYDGKTFALSAQACPKGEVSTGTAADGKPVCVKDADTQYTGKDFALSDKKCDPNKVVAGFTADGAPICVLDQKGESTGKDFALSNQKCADGQVSKGVDIDGKPICVADADTKYTGKDFALSDQTCPTGQVLNGISAAGKMLCVVDKDNDTKYSGKNFAVSNQTCAADQKLVGVDGEGVKICASDADTKYSGKDFALSDQKCATGQVLTGIDANGYKLCTPVGGTSHNHNYDVNDPWLRENGQDAPFKAHGGKYQIVMRTDGTGQYATGIGDYPFVWMYGGDVSANRHMMLDKDGNIWTATYGWLQSRFAAANKTCPKGQVMSGVKADGDPLCVVDQNTATIYKAGTGLTLTSDTFSLNLTYADGRYVNAGEANAITSAMIQNGQVTSADIADNSVTTADVLNGSLTGDDIADSSLTGTDIKDGTIASADVADNSLTGTDIADSSLTGADIKDSSLTGADITDESLTGGDIKNGTVSGADIQNESVTSADIDDGTLKYTDTDVNSIQRRVTGTCPAGQAIQTITSGGTVTCAAEVGAASTKYTGSTVKGNWYRIASTGAGHEVSATFTVYDTTYNTNMQFRVGVSSGFEGGISFTLLSHSRDATLVFEKLRVLEAASTAPHYLDIKFAQSAAVSLHVTDNLHENSWLPEAPKIIGTSDTISGFNSRIYDLDKVFSTGDYTERLAVHRGGDTRVLGNFGIGNAMSYPLHVTTPKANDWQARLTNANSNVYLNHASGYGMHINTGVADNASVYMLEAANKSGTALFVRGDRKVGINTTSPAEALHVNGNIRGASTNGALRIQTAGGYIDVGPKDSSFGHIETDRGGFYFNKRLRVDEGIISSHNEDLQLQTSGTTRIQVSTANGNVGVGYGPDNAWKLKVAGAGYFNGQLRTDDWVYAGKNTGLHWHANQWGGTGDEAYIQYYSETGENTKLRILNNNDADDDIEFFQAGAARMNIYNGNVGIGYDTPDWKLKVNGNGYFQSTLRFDGALQADGNTVIDDGGGWHRSYGNTGWYNNTHGGGIYMEDSTYVRVYGSKKFRSDSGIYIGTNHVAKGNQNCPGGQVATGINSAGDLVCSGTTGTGTVYTRWGRSSCPSGASLVYWGYAAGSHYTHGGSGSNLLCLRRDPNYLQYNVANHDGGLIYGVEYETDLTGLSETRGAGQHDNEAVCAVCYVPTRNTMFMQPGNYTCPSGWTTEYYGYLMSERHSHSGRGTYICVDRNPELYGSNYNHNGALLYHVEAECGALPCGSNANGAYYQNKELTCAVCTR